MANAFQDPFDFFRLEPHLKAPYITFEVKPNSNNLKCIDKLTEYLECLDDGIEKFPEMEKEAEKIAEEAE